MEENSIVEIAAEPHGMKIGAEEKLLLGSSAKWAKFIAIVSLVMYGLCILFMIMWLIAGLVAGLSMYDISPGVDAALYQSVMWPVMIFCIVIYIVMIFPAINLLQFAQKAKQAIASDDQTAMTESFRNLRSYLKITGIIFIVSLAFSILLVIGAFTAALVMTI